MATGEGCQLPAVGRWALKPTQALKAEDTWDTKQHGGSLEEQGVPSVTGGYWDVVGAGGTHGAGVGSRHAACAALCFRPGVDMFALGSPG